ncbi:BCAS2 family protein [Paecilomyces variotii No. 5]|uniref:BCAS2 family protein n=1 Tax=Byssochlamys spectabilis (strain No. 5 / NBRC 109023) TaxID=1356009 RepID=V5FMZ6_BYSSN|nr:BCAS2 family protein [Paecilomyces variotii No. 5]
MSLINESHDSLPYIDSEPNAGARAAAEKLISAELSSDYQSSLHPSIPALVEPHFSPLVQQELARKEAGLPMTGGIDLSRYEAPETPSGTASGKNASEALNEWRETLQRAYTSSSHLSMRHENLTLLEEHGKNAWLIGNAQLEEVLRGLEKELADTRAAVESVHKERKMAQEASKGELVGLQETWRRGVGAVLDVELAAESLRLQILDQRRQLSQQQAR